MSVRLALARRLRWRLSWVVLAWIVVVHTAANAIWIQADAFVVQEIQDQGTHISSLTHLVTNLEIGGVEAALRAFREFHHFYPTVAHLPLALASVVFEPSPTVYRLANGFYFVLFVLGVHALGRRLRGEGAGLLAAALGALMPAVFGGWRTVGLDFPLVAVTPWAVLVVLRSDGFSRLRWAAAFGLLAGLAALIKVHALAFLFAPAAVAWVRGLWVRRADRPALRRTLLGGAAAVGVLLLVSAVWWWGRLGFLGQLAVNHATGHNLVPGDVISASERPGYVLAQLPGLLSPGLALGALLLLPRCLRMRRGGVEVFAWLVTPLLLFGLLGLRQPRYLLALAAPAAVVLGAGLWSLGGRLRPAATAAAALSALAVWLLGSYTGVTAATDGASLTPSSAVDRLLLARSFLNHPPRPARAAHEHRLVRTLAETLERSHPARGEGALVFFSDEQQAATLAVALQQRLPRLRLLFHGFPDGDRLYMFRLPPRRERYLLQRLPSPIPSPPAPHRRVLELPCGEDGAEAFQCEALLLFRLAPSAPWPPWLLAPDPRGLSPTTAFW